MSAPTVGARTLFVYYRVPLVRSAEAYRAVSRMQESLCRRLEGLQARLMRRTDEHGDVPLEQTWMEVYEHPEGINALCEQMLLEAVSNLPDGLLGTRHTECFESMPSLAHPQTV